MSTLTLAPAFALPTGTLADGRPASTADVRRTTDPAARGQLRLTRRGRLVLLALFVGLALAAATLLGSWSEATGERGPAVPTRTVVVGAGDTLWGLAAEVAAPGQVQQTVQRIIELNALEGSGLQLGQELAVPLG